MSINMGLKIDIRKAFDTMRWTSCFWFLKGLASVMYFVIRLETFQSLHVFLFYCMSRPKGILVVSEESDKVIHFLHSYFFLGEDYLSRLLTTLVSQCDFVPMECGCRVVPPSHFLYVDDILVFGRASKCNIKVIVDAFNDYGRVSGQQVSWENPIFILVPIHL